MTTNKEDAELLLKFPVGLKKRLNKVKEISTELTKLHSKDVDKLIVENRLGRDNG